MSKMKLRDRIQYAKVAINNAFHAFKEDVKGLSGIEFAMIAPMLIGVYLGVAETALGVTNSRKVSRVAATLADLVAQSENITASQVDGIMNASISVMEPYSGAPLNIYVVGVQMDADGIARVAWSRVKGASASAPGVGSIYPVPDDIRIANSFLVATQVTYDYTPGIGSGIIDTFHFNEKNYNIPRTSATVEYTDDT